MKKSLLILTDSGGIQEEAPTLRKPALILRNVTERPEGLKTGFLKLVGCQKDNIVFELTNLLSNLNDHEKMASVENPYGDGKASQRIIDAICHHFGNIKERPVDFQPKINQLVESCSEA
jgi:UDP-N-acetylglucosamine 2-epimerase (non-hydrolysing)